MSGQIRVSTSTSFTLTGRVTVTDLLLALRKIPAPHATLRFETYKGDQRDSGYTRVTATWDAETEEED